MSNTEEIVSHLDHAISVIEGGPDEFVEDVERIRRMFEESSTSPPNSTPDHLSGAIYPEDTILHDYLGFGRTTQESADSYLLGSIIPVVAAILARKVYFPWADDRLYPNVFSIIVGRPGDRKSSAIKLGERLARQLLPDKMFLPETTSAEALFDEYDDSVGGCPDKLLIADDANPMLATWRKTSYGEVVGKRFLNLADCRPLAESFRQNRKKNERESDNVERPTSRRFIPETSTSLLLGATHNIARFQGHEIQDGMARRFLYYTAGGHGRLIALPPRTDRNAVQEIGNLFRPLLTLEKVCCSFSNDAEAVWRRFQSDNRNELSRADDTTEKGCARASRLNSLPHQALKIAMIFQSTRWAAGDCQRSWDGVIEQDILQKAISHAQLCFEAACALDMLADRFEIEQEAESIYSRIVTDFRDGSLEEFIVLTKTDLTSKFASNPRRHGALTPDRLYNGLIPALIRKGKAALVDKKGKRVRYAFRIDD